MGTSNGQPGLLNLISPLRTNPMYRHFREHEGVERTLLRESLKKMLGFYHYEKFSFLISNEEERVKNVCLKLLYLECTASSFGEVNRVLLDPLLGITIGELERIMAILKNFISWGSETLGAWLGTI